MNHRVDSRPVDSRPIVVFLMICCGALIGAMGGLVLKARKSASGKAPLEDSTNTAAVGQTEPPAADYHRLVAPIRPIVPIPLPQPAEQSHNHRLLSREESRGLRSAEHAERIKNHYQEPVDPIWSTHAEAIVGATLAGMAKQDKFNINKVECRRTSCIADIGWSNLDDARKTYRDLLHGGYGDVNCAREIMIPDDQSPADPVSARLVLDHCPR